MPEKHSKYGGSTMARTIGCPAWQELSKDIPRAEAGPHADEGTMLHNCMELIYDDDNVTIGNIIQNSSRCKHNDAELTLELYKEKLVPAYEAMEKLLDELDIDDYEVEPFVELIPDVNEEGEPEDASAGGSIDFLGVSADGKTVLVADYKFGYHQVNAENNKQGLFYALCAALDPATQHFFEEAETVVIAIVQPNDQGEVVDDWEFDIDLLDDFEQEVYDAIDKAEAGKGQPCVGSWCKYCPAEALCPAKTGSARAALRLDVEQTDQLAEALTLVGDIEDWAKAVRKMAHEQLELGTDVPGWKLVAKRATRKWTDESKVLGMVKKLRKIKVDEATTVKLATPAALEKLCKSHEVDFEKFTDYIESVSSGTTIAPESDKRPKALAQGSLEELSNALT